MSAAFTPTTLTEHLLRKAATTEDIGDATDFAHAAEVITEFAEAMANAMVLLGRYRRETPLGHQPHMIASEADVALIQGATLLAKARGEVE